MIVSVPLAFFSGLTSGSFKGIASIQEVECTGSGLKPEVKLMSLRMQAISDPSPLASLNVFTNTCMTYTDYSSCVVDIRNTHMSALRILVYDLGVGESREYECVATVLKPSGKASEVTWSIVITERSKMCWVLYFHFVSLVCWFVFFLCRWPCCFCFVCQHV